MRRDGAVVVSEYAQQDAPVLPTCWCCGQRYPDAELLRLGSHPEVGVCVRCVRWLRRRARERVDAGRVDLGAVLRRTIRQARAVVIEHGWQHRPILGPALRRIDRHLP